MQNYPKVIPVRLTEDRYAQVMAAARLLEMPAGAWLRRAIVEKLERDAVNASADQTLRAWAEAKLERDNARV